MGLAGHGRSRPLRVDQIENRKRLSQLRWEMVGPDRWPAAMHLALDEVLLDRVAGGFRGPTLRWWEWTEPALIIGSHQVLANEVDSDKQTELGLAVARRMSGGGTMVVIPEGSITYSIYAPEELVEGLSLVDSYALLDSWVVEALQAIGVPAAYRPINDLVDPHGKMGGAAQARRRGAILHHTTIAWAIDPELVPRLIRIGRPSLSSRGVRSAEKVVSPLSRHTDLSREEMVRHLADWFRRLTDADSGSLGGDEIQAAAVLAKEKYEAPDWLHRFE